MASSSSVLIELCKRTGSSVAPAARSDLAETGGDEICSVGSSAVNNDGAADESDAVVEVSSTRWIAAGATEETLSAVSARCLGKELAMAGFCCDGLSIGAAPAVEIGAG